MKKQFYFLFLLILTSFVLGCSKSDGDGADQSSQTTALDIISTQSYDVGFDYFITDGSVGAIIEIDETTDMPTSACLYDPDSDTSATIYFDEFGRPSMYMLDEVCFVLENYDGSTVDVAIIIDNEVFYELSVDTGVNWDDDFFTFWINSTNTRAIDWDKLGDAFSSEFQHMFQTVLIGVSYGIESIPAMVELRTGNSAEKLVAFGTIATKLGEAILEVAPYLQKYEAAISETSDFFKLLDYVNKTNKSLFGTSEDAKEVFESICLDKLVEIIKEKDLSIDSINELIESARSELLTSDEPNVDEPESSADGDRAILERIYAEAGGENWRYSTNWCTDAPLEDWSGISTNSDGRVTILNLDLAWTGGNNVVGELDVTGLDYLTQVDCANNSITSLNVSNCSNLRYINCNSNSIETLNIESCSNLYYISCTNNKLTQLNNIANNINLENLYCSDNNITSINVDNCSKLKYLTCSNNDLTSLSVNGCTSLASLVCSDNNLPSLDVSGLDALNILTCDNNKLTSLTIEKKISVSCRSNQIKIVDVSKVEINSEWFLMTVDCYYNPVEIVYLPEYYPDLYVNCDGWGDQDTNIYTSPEHKNGWQYPAYLLK